MLTISSDWMLNFVNYIKLIVKESFFTAFQYKLFLIAK